MAEGEKRRGLGRGILDLIGSFGRPERQKATLENEQLRENLKTTRGRNAAIARLPALLLPGPLETRTNPITGAPLSAADDPTAKPQRESELMGVLGAIAPQAAATSMLSPERGVEGRFSAIEKRLGRPLSGDEALTIGAPGSSDSSLDQLLKFLGVQDLTGKLTKEREADITADLATDRGIEDGLEGFLRLSQANDALEGTLLESGGSFLELKRQVAATAGDVAGLLGAGETASGIDKMITDFDTLSKETSVAASDSMRRLSDAGITVTRAAQALVESANASTKVSPGTNRSIMKVTINQLLRAANDRKIELPNRGAYEQLLERFDGTEFEFFTVEEVNNAIQAGALQKGDTFTLNGEQQRVK